MGAAHRSSNSTTYASRTNTTLTAPSGIQNGDVLIITWLCGRDSGTPPTPTPPSGFAAVAGTWPISLVDGTFTVHVHAWYKVASSESGNYTVTHTNITSQGYIAAISGGGSSQPASTTNSGTGTTTTALSITPSGNDALVMFLGTDWGTTTNALSPPTGSTPTFTERLDPGTVSGIMYVADGVLATAGATGNKTQTNNSSGAQPWSGVLVVVEATGGGVNEQPMARRGLWIPGMNMNALAGPLS